MRRRTRLAIAPRSTSPIVADSGFGGYLANYGGNYGGTQTSTQSIGQVGSPASAFTRGTGGTVSAVGTSADKFAAPAPLQPPDLSAGTVFNLPSYFDNSTLFDTSFAPPALIAPSTTPYWAAPTATAGNSTPPGAYSAPVRTPQGTPTMPTTGTAFASAFGNFLGYGTPGGATGGNAGAQTYGLGTWLGYGQTGAGAGGTLGPVTITPEKQAGTVGYNPGGYDPGHGFVPQPVQITPQKQAGTVGYDPGHGPGAGAKPSSGGGQSGGGASGGGQSGGGGGKAPVPSLQPGGQNQQPVRYQTTTPAPIGPPASTPTTGTDGNGNPLPATTAPAATSSIFTSANMPLILGVGVIAILLLTHHSGKR